MHHSTSPFVGHATNSMKGDFVLGGVDTHTCASIVIDHTQNYNVENKGPTITCQYQIQTTTKNQQKQQLMRHAPIRPILEKHTTNKMPTPIKVDILERYLQGYDINLKAYLLQGFKEGFRLEFEGESKFQQSPNLKSANENHILVTEKINKELALNRVAGPFNELPIKNLKVSPLGLVPKKTEGQFRLIHHLSYPNKKLNSVNSGISDESAAVQYAGINDAITEIKKLGKQVYLAKSDVRQAFRILPVSPQDYELLGFFWEKKYYFDRCLPMGCRTSCKIFERFSSALQWIAINKLGMSAMVHILDDFLIIETSKESAIQKLKLFIQLCEEMGVPLSAEKTVLPTQIIEFVGITLDVLAAEARLPLEKIDKCNNLLKKFMSMTRCTLKNMQSLIGVLNFACSVIQPGRAFLRRMINLTVKVSEHQQYLYLTEETKADMKIWLSFLENYNGKSMFLNDTFLSSGTLELYTDAAQSKGYSGVYRSQWFYGSFPDDWKTLNIMTLEFYPIILSVEIWGPLWKNHAILFFTDNEALVSVINKQTSQVGQVMRMVRHLVLRCLQYNILFKAKHIPGKKNILADCLSRFQVEQFFKLAPKAQNKPRSIPEIYLPKNFWKTLKR